ncbi:hypothetical protein [Acidicapsa ligni]|uniref:hypothetical protein n=1 Tax=Acidicapsa ligni TaxID=542300 RepID=UPI0021E023F6|nr:hypothetical protein [Acidicapsa ligni]
MNDSDTICAVCYARVSEAAHASACPVCRGALLPYSSLDATASGVETLDHRGLVLPRRHAVGGVITPR